MFEKGHVVYFPRSCTLAKHDLLGGEIHEAEVESDLDQEVEESEADPAEEFMQAAEEVFLSSVKQQEDLQWPEKEYQKTIIKEIRSVKLSHNVENNDVLVILCELVTGQFLGSPLVEPTTAAVRKEITKTINLYSPLLKDYCSSEEE
mmetsp:Transcript_18291/g.28110  ORF Transcript_18291/g.28110 Transcript_18291/m.28110 type:complete len:147 (+) Transcript_18291:1435-1875(+)